MRGWETKGCLKFFGIALLLFFALLLLLAIIDPADPDPAPRAVTAQEVVTLREKGLLTPATETPAPTLTTPSPGYDPNAWNYFGKAPDCMTAFESAAAVSDLRDQHSDLWPAFQACLDLDEWVAASRAHPDALDGADPIQYAFNQCAGEKAVGGSNICKAMAWFEQPDDYGYLGSRLLGYQADSEITATGGIGVSVRYACDLDARDREGAAWPEGQAVTVFAVGVEQCEGWSLVRGPERSSWVSDQYLEPFERDLGRITAYSDTRPVTPPDAGRSGPQGVVSLGKASPPTQAPLRVSTPAPEPEMDIEDCFSPWDGNLNALEDLVRPLLNDPGSMDTISTEFTVEPRPDGYHGVLMRFSAKNAFGGRIQNFAIGRVRLPDCHVILDEVVPA